MTRRAALLAALLLLPAQGAWAQAPPVAETIAIPLIEKRLLGAPRELSLEAFPYRPASPGPLPVLVFNHGSTGAGRVSPADTEYYRYPEVARFFVSRGWAVLVPMRRGRGASGGEYLERYDCDRAILTAGVERAVEDLDAVLAFVAAQPWADPARLLLGGMSRGGLLAVVYPSRRAVAARGVVNFAGGWTGERCDGRTRLNADTFAEAGRTARLPMLWLYSENDRNYGPASVRAYHQGFVRAGGTAASEFLTRLGLGEP